MIGVGRDFKDHIAPTPCHVQRHMVCLFLHLCYVDLILPHVPWLEGLNYNLVHLWYFFLRLWCRGFLQKAVTPQGWVPCSPHTKGSTSHLQHMNCCSTPTTHCHHFKYSIFSLWAFLLYVYPIVFPSCPFCPYKSLKETEIMATQ